ncbi:Cysteine-rich membrane protein 2 [Spironucleus salmonicida]|uniref:Cysteine-rich membrane protein 2 n=1 Tax=Spironucleus salmonicida TaxID=348837 RepID=V6LE40_9EUKA|nr:Cysteine-rich membrane protein 2 [Spironucleus salmonicida]|eukprot:EST41961.1 Cysteine-rich membrane protein 2 [Spironucleus salmonicida]
MSIANCKTNDPVDGTKCKECNPPYVLVTNNTACAPLTPNMCLVFTTDCSTCDFDAPQLCTACTNDKVPARDTNTCETCAKPLVPNAAGTECVGSQCIGIQDCATCDKADPTHCAGCTNGAVPSTDGLSCVGCPEGQVANSEGTGCLTPACLKDIKFCVKCSIDTPSLCSECEPGKGLMKGGLFCIDCMNGPQLVDKCTKCNVPYLTECDECIDGYSPDTINNKCLLNTCIFGSTAIEGCLTCQASNKMLCLTCEDALVPNLAGTHCVVDNCFAHVKNCAACDAKDAATCSLCDEGRRLKEGQCDSCDDAHIETNGKCEQIQKLSAGGIIGIVIAVILVAAGFAVFGVYLFKKYKQNKASTLIKDQVQAQIGSQYEV